MTIATTIGRILCAVLFLLSVGNNLGVEAFGTHGINSRGSCRQQQQQLPLRQLDAFGTYGDETSSSRCHRRTTALGLVSEEDVLEAVERAETLWAEALEARKTANALIDKAEAEANASAGTAKEAENIFRDKTTPVTMQELVQVDSAAKASLDATSLVNKAMEASDEAERLETEAEEALKKSEETLDQHLLDFPDSSLAD